MATLANGAIATVVVGQNFHGTIASAPVDRTPKKEPAQVTLDPAMTRSDLLSVRRRVPFRLELPRFVANFSKPEFDAPIRVYNIKKGRKAVRMTFATGLNEYGGSEETNWDQAPALADASFTHPIHKRQFSLYYSGAHLHMVVLRENGATYWVVNTNLYSLSNETKIAISPGRGPRPQPPPPLALERDDARDRARAAAAAQVTFRTGMAESRTIGVFGAGWVGLVTGGCFA